MWLADATQQEIYTTQSNWVDVFGCCVYLITCQKLKVKNLINANLLQLSVYAH